MKAGGVLGIIGGLLALLVGVIGYSIGGTASSIMGGLAAFTDTAQASQVNAEVQASLQFYRLLAIVLPIVGLVGAGMAFSNGRRGALLMGISAAGILWTFGVGFFSLICAVLLGVGAFLAYSGSAKASSA
jgi:hypothetical protein